MHTVAATALVVATAVVGWLPFWAALPAYLAATAAFLWLAHETVAGRWRPSLPGALVVAVLLRAVCLPHPPSLSDDIYRYMHEGRMVLAGYNPYLVAPSAAPDALRGDTFELINNPDISAAYPPAVQYAAAVGVLLAPGPIGIKLVFGLLDLLLFLALWRWLPSLGVVSERAILHGFCPLVAVEFAGQGHGDSAAILFVTLAVFAAAHRRSALAGGVLAVATAAKLMPVVLLPFVLRRGGRVVGVVAFAVVLAVLFAPFLAAPAELLRGTEQYSRRWSGNETLYAPILWAAQAAEHAGWLSGFESKWLREGQGVAKLPLLLLATGLLAGCWRRGLTAHRVGFWFFVFFVAFAPTVHPWYVGLLVPFLCVYPNPGLLVFTGTVFLAYHPLPGWQAGAGWHESWWLKALEYAPFYAGVWLSITGRDGQWSTSQRR